MYAAIDSFHITWDSVACCYLYICAEHCYIFNSTIQADDRYSTYDTYPHIMGYQEAFSVSQYYCRTVIAFSKKLPSVQHWYCTQGCSQGPHLFKSQVQGMNSTGIPIIPAIYSGSVDFGKASKGSLLVTDIIFYRTASTLSVECRNFS